MAQVKQPHPPVSPYLKELDTQIHFHHSDDEGLSKLNMTIFET